MQALSTGPAKDEMLKNALADYAAENFEVASYTALIRAAQFLGDQETARVCQQILQEDQEMASWLQQNLPTLVQQTLLQLTR
jgi:ferritin-like metal-binding protein YciE